MKKLSIFLWNDEETEGFNYSDVDTFNLNNEIDLSDEDALNIARRILNEVTNGNHISFRIDGDED